MTTASNQGSVTLDAWKGTGSGAVDFGTGAASELATSSARASIGVVRARGTSRAAVALCLSVERETERG